MIYAKVKSHYYFKALLIATFLPFSTHAAENQTVAAKGRASIKGGTHLVCPPPSTRPTTPEMLFLDLIPCKSNLDCPLHLELGLLCCEAKGRHQNRCRHGVPPPKPKPTHAPLLGVIQRQCPEDESFPEFLPVHTCSNDDQCWPRICCNQFCRTPSPPQQPSSKNGTVPFMTLRAAAEYLQCTPPPLFDFFSRPCRTIRDCFPHMCCQENDKKVCRPAKKSILPILATIVKENGEG